MKKCHPTLVIEFSGDRELSLKMCRLTRLVSGLFV